MDDVRANLERVREQMARAARRAGRRPEDILLIGVSKTVPAERVRAALEGGLPAVGENRVQEAATRSGHSGTPCPGT